MKRRSTGNVTHKQAELGGPTMDALRIALASFLFLLVFSVTTKANADGFSLSGTSFTILNVPGAYSIPGTNSTVATGINDVGQIVGYYRDGTTFDYRGFVYTAGTFSVLDFPGGSTSLSGINNSGQIVGDSLSGGFLYSGGTITATSGPGGIALDPRGINNNGQIVGSFVDSTGGHGFIQTGSSFIPLTFPGAITTVALGINDSGEVVGSYTTPGNEFGFLYSGGTFSTIICPGSIGGDALGINNSGAIVGDCLAGGHLNGFLYTSGTYTFVDVPFHAANEAIGINNKDQIVGYTGDAVPEGGGTLAFLVVGLAGLALWQRKQRGSALA